VTTRETASPAPFDRADRVALGALAVGLAAFLLAPFVLDGFAFPLGPDAPVYLWWTRIAGLEGISAAGERPGVPALLLELTGATGLPLVAIVAAAEVVFGTAIGVGAAALVRTRVRSRTSWVLAGALAGLFSVHLVAGYLANLIFTVGFLAAAVCIGERDRRATWGAAALLGLTGLAHPYFFLVGALVLAVTAWLARRDAAADDATPDADPGEPRRIVTALLGGALVVGAGMLTTLWGARPPNVETSRDGFLRRVGLGAELARAYRERFVDRWARYVQWASLPLAVVGVGAARGFLARFLLAWSGVTVAGVIVGLATAWYPPDRFVTFGFAIPILAALGVVRLPTLLHQRWRGRWRTFGYAAGAGLTIAMVLGASFAWFRSEPYIEEVEVRAVEGAGRSLDEVQQPAVLRFAVDDAAVDAPTFLVARAWNIAMASVPSDRIRWVVPFLPARPTASAEREAVSRALIERGEHVTAEAVRSGPPGTTGADHTVEAFLPPFLVGTGGNPRDGVPDSGIEVGDGARAPVDGAPRDPLERTSPGGIVVASVAVAALVVAVGFGWSAAALRSPFARVATAPAFGAAASIALGLFADRIGIRLSGPVPLILAVLAGAGGYATLFLQRRSAAQASDEVDQ
jgi:hypothetical protein